MWQTLLTDLLTAMPAVSTRDDPVPDPAEIARRARPCPRGAEPGLRLRLVPRRAGGGHPPCRRGRRLPRADADRQRQVAVLPDPGVGPPRRRRRRLAADRADEGPGRRAAPGRGAGG